MPAITLREVIAELAAGARIVADDDNTFELQYPGTPITGHMLNHELVRHGWVESAPNGGSYRLTDAGRLAYIQSTDELGDGELRAPKDGVGGVSTEPQPAGDSTVGLRERLGLSPAGVKVCRFPNTVDGARLAAAQELRDEPAAGVTVGQWCHECMANVKKPCSYKDCPVGVGVAPAAEPWDGGCEHCQRTDAKPRPDDEWCEHCARGVVGLDGKTDSPTTGGGHG